MGSSAATDRLLTKRRNGRASTRLKRYARRRKNRLDRLSSVPFDVTYPDVGAWMIRLSVWSRLWSWFKSLFQRGR